MAVDMEVHSSRFLGEFREVTEASGKSWAAWNCAASLDEITWPSFLLDPCDTLSAIDVAVIDYNLDLVVGLHEVRLT